MPSSFVDSFAPIIKLLIDSNPQRVVDIGPGWGKYGLGCREYLPDLETLSAVEVTEGRLPIQDAIYDRVYTTDVRGLATFDDFWTRFDLALMVDVIEHMTLDEGHSLLRSIQKQGCAVLVSTPKVFTEQHDDHNPYETHQCVWDFEEFARHGILVDVSTIDSIIYLLRAR